MRQRRRLRAPGERIRPPDRRHRHRRSDLRQRDHAGARPQPAGDISTDGGRRRTPPANRTTSSALDRGRALALRRGHGDAQPRGGLPRSAISGVTNVNNLEFDRRIGARWSSQRSQSTDLADASLSPPPRLLHAPPLRREHRLLVHGPLRRGSPEAPRPLAAWKRFLHARPHADRLDLDRREQTSGLTSRSGPRLGPCAGSRASRRRAGYLVSSNHRSWVDIAVLQRVLQPPDPLPEVLPQKAALLVPFLGQAWWALDFPFMQRHSREELEKHPRSAARTGDDAARVREVSPRAHVDHQLPRGGRASPRAKHARQGIATLRHLLLPKAEGWRSSSPRSEEASRRSST